MRFHDSKYLFAPASSFKHFPKIHRFLLSVGTYSIDFIKASNKEYIFLKELNNNVSCSAIPESNVDVFNLINPLPLGQLPGANFQLVSIVLQNVFVNILLLLQPLLKNFNLVLVTCDVCFLVYTAINVICECVYLCLYFLHFEHLLCFCLSEQ